MGEAKRRQASESGIVWHHTSILRTNLIWMSGVVDVEGQSKGALHPVFGEVRIDASFRRAMKDFPALAWFSSDFTVPKCLQNLDVIGLERGFNLEKRRSLSPEETSAYAMNRMALGFRHSDVPVVPWPEHYGYQTGEGRELNDSALAVGDNPDDWWVSEQPVDVGRMCIIRGSGSPIKMKMERRDDYLPHALRMVELCRTVPRTLIPPSWVGGPIHRAVLKAGSIHPSCRQFDALAGL